MPGRIESAEQSLRNVPQTDGVRRVAEVTIDGNAHCVHYENTELGRAIVVDGDGVSFAGWDRDNPRVSLNDLNRQIDLREVMASQEKLFPDLLSPDIRAKVEALKHGPGTKRS
ncbi:hypothetical protein HYS91_03970 [Candidatus Daviesbacteria bacterium]|nr:hypothetical protein [Candidatus Daviesbacteria bacterium]